MEAWDCNPEHIHDNIEYDLDIDEDDWQLILLDRFGDRMVNGELR